MYEQVLDQVADATRLKDLMRESTQFEFRIGECMNSLTRCMDSLSVHANKNEKATVHNSTVKLPRLKIKKFDGELTEWISFYDSFRAAVQESNTLFGEIFARI